MFKFRQRSMEKDRLIHFDDFSGGVSVLVVGVAGSLVGFELFFPICCRSSRFCFFLSLRAKGSENHLRRRDAAMETSSSSRYLTPRGGAIPARFTTYSTKDERGKLKGL